MWCFELACPLAGNVVEVRFTGENAPRGKATFRGFTCESEGECAAAAINCALYDERGAEPFAPADALRHLNG